MRALLLFDVMIITRRMETRWLSLLLRLPLLALLLWGTIVEGEKLEGYSLSVVAERLTMVLLSLDEAVPDVCTVVESLLALLRIVLEACGGGWLWL